VLAAQITPEFFFQEADFSSNLLIQGNVFDSYFGGIELAFISDSNLLPGQFQNHANINITNNIIRVRQLPTASHSFLPTFRARKERTSVYPLRVQILHAIVTSSAGLKLQLKRMCMSCCFGSCKHAEQPYRVTVTHAYCCLKGNALYRTA
jgi:hypothetical protein